MTFTFTMDCFPDYTHFDKTHKVFCAMQIIGDENIHPDEEIAAEDVKCEDLDPALTSVTAGCADWETTTLTDGGRDFSTLGNNLKATVDRANIDFYGNLNKITNWTEFSDNEADLTGYYLPFQMKADDGVKFVYTTPSGEEQTLTFGDTDDGAGTINIVMAVDASNPVVVAKLVSADGSKTSEYTIDMSKLNFK